MTVDVHPRPTPYHAPYIQREALINRRDTRLPVHAVTPTAHATRTRANVKRAYNSPSAELRNYLRGETTRLTSCDAGVRVRDASFAGVEVCGHISTILFLLESWERHVGALDIFLGVRKVVEHRLIRPDDP